MRENYEEIENKIRRILKSGHIPCRQNIPYTKETIPLVNCFEHACFNFTNKQIVENFSSTDSHYFWGDWSTTSYENTEEELLSTLHNVGLNVREFSEGGILKNNEWKVALYFTQHFSLLDGDFHFLLQEHNKQWSEKNGFDGNYKQFPKLPETLSDEENPMSNRFNLYKTYVIQNPYAREK